MARDGGNRLNENIRTGDWRIDVGSCVFPRCLYNLFSSYLSFDEYLFIIMEYNTRSSFDYHKVMQYLIII